MKYLIEEIDFTTQKRNSHVVDADNTMHAKEIALKKQSFNGMLRIYDNKLCLICYKYFDKNDWQFSI